MLQSAIKIEEREKFLYWKNVSLEVGTVESKGCCKKETKWKYILKNVSGYIRSGEQLAIMGGSGAGKSTMLNIISGRFLSGKLAKVTGEVMLNGQKMDWNKFRFITGFVLQKDIFMEVLTVREVFEFVVNLKNPKLSPPERLKKVNKMIELLKLQRAENNQVGGVTAKGISGGEKRRLNIGVELL